MYLTVDRKLMGSVLCNTPTESEKQTDRDRERKREELIESEEEQGERLAAKIRVLTTHLSKIARGEYGQQRNSTVESERKGSIGDWTALTQLPQTHSHPISTNAIFCTPTVSAFKVFFSFMCNFFCWIRIDENSYYYYYYFC